MAIYFASDTHLGLDLGDKNPINREKLFVRWLEKIETDCTELFLVGDIFDFWFEWRRVVPKGYVRLLAKLATMSDRGIKIHFLIGNHDQWQMDYLEKEIGVVLHTEPLVVERQGKTLFIAHGDKFYDHDWFGGTIQKLFTNQTIKNIARKVIHPNAMIRFGQSWSRSSREKHGEKAYVFAAEDDFLVKFVRKYINQADNKTKIDYFIFGHEHTPVVYTINDDTDMVILGEWINCPFYARMDESRIELIEFLGL